MKNEKKNHIFHDEEMSTKTSELISLKTDNKI